MNKMREQLDEKFNFIANIDMTIEKKDKLINDLKQQVEKWRDESI